VLVALITINSKVDQSAWQELKDLAEKSHQSISGVLTEAIREYVGRRRVRPDVTRHLEDSLSANGRLGRLLAR
jgi:predicted transcriptional regulator